MILMPIFGGLFPSYSKSLAFALLTGSIVINGLGNGLSQVSTFSLAAETDPI